MCRESIVKHHLRTDRSVGGGRSHPAPCLPVCVLPRRARAPIARRCLPTDRLTSPHWLLQTVRGDRKNRIARSRENTCSDHVTEKSGRCHTRSENAPSRAETIHPTG